jgi:hypothetical protein
MSAESSGRRIFDVAMETGAYAWILTRAAGGLAYTKAMELKEGKPAAGRPHISQEIERTLPINEALVGKQFVEIGAMFREADPQTTQEERDMQDRSKGYKRYGYGRIAQALRKADTDEIHGHDVVQQVITIAKEVGLNPSKMDDTLSELEQEQVRRIIEP